MAGNGEDTHALLAGDDAVTVVTLHSAKGLEWPVTIMSEIGKTFDANPLGVRVMHDKPFNMQNPLADRWLRYWLFPYHPKNKDTLFQHRMAQHPSNEEIVRQHERQELRALYVGWTRARDRLILAGRKKEFSGGILGLLTDEKENWLLSEPKGGKATWAGKRIQVQTRILSSVDAEPASAFPGTDYVIPDKPIQHPPERLTPSSMEGSGEVIRIDQIGERIPITGNPDMDVVGNAFHLFFAADRPEFDDQERLKLSKGIVQRWQLICIIDHKTFAGNKEEAARKAAEFYGQLNAYGDILQNQYEQASILCYIHYPIIGVIVEIDVVT